MQLSRAKADIFVPGDKDLEQAIKKTTHLGVGAHQDDLEIMAFHGIAECYKKRDKHFGGVICTDGVGSPRTGKYANISDRKMMEIRRAEQRSAAEIGGYAFAIQLGHPSQTIRGKSNKNLHTDLRTILELSRPDVVYTHNLADSHETHLSVALHLVRALRDLSRKDRPKKVLGCEVWRSLDWLPEHRKISLDVSKHDALAKKLLKKFKSQIEGGKRYDLATFGRRLGNATFTSSHSVDHGDQVCLAMDLTPLILSDRIDPRSYLMEMADEFRHDLRRVMYS